MRYPIAIELGDEKYAYGVVVPDIEGCFSAGDTLDEALINVHEAIDMMIELILEDGKPFPMPSSIENHINDPDLKLFIWTMVDVDVSRFLKCHV
ncbi:MAG: type II toxin-antitoxin system HicB family antitoxin [Moraxellaceae bacterium]|nr:type II toxin-antitoxin system HicB family antitoxin [Pseudomonadales bacterium]MCP5177221.1 type II toxin-antitoxin system HicB family antitoxin [Moraxellaceae bacterium]